jgi:hypothetical protein
MTGEGTSNCSVGSTTSRINFIAEKENGNELCLAKDRKL